MALFRIYCILYDMNLIIELIHYKQRDISSLMNCLRLLRNLVLRFDLFAATPTLRVNGETDYEHVCCGSFSIVLILAFLGIFAQQIINVLNKA